MSRSLAAGIGLAPDRLLGEPTRVPHPVAAFGTAIGHLERWCYAPTRPSPTRRPASRSAPPPVGFARSTALATYVAVAGRALGEAALAVNTALDADDLDAARRLLPALVGRDPSDLDEKEICRAVVESVAENTVDAVIAPLLWPALAGGPGALGYRAVNTMDAMVGYRSARYRESGWAAARLDDAANWVPHASPRSSSPQPAHPERPPWPMPCGATHPATCHPTRASPKPPSPPRSACASAARTATANESSCAPRSATASRARRHHPRRAAVAGHQRTTRRVTGRPRVRQTHAGATDNQAH